MGKTRLNDLVEMSVSSEEFKAIKIDDIRDLFWQQTSTGHCGYGLVKPTSSICRLPISYM